MRSYFFKIFDSLQHETWNEWSLCKVMCHKIEWFALVWSIKFYFILKKEWLRDKLENKSSVLYLRFRSMTSGNESDWIISRTLFFGFATNEHMPVFPELSMHTAMADLPLFGCSRHFHFHQSINQSIMVSSYHHIIGMYIHIDKLDW